MTPHMPPNTILRYGMTYSNDTLDEAIRVYRTVIAAVGEWSNHLGVHLKDVRGFTEDQLKKEIGLREYLEGASKCTIGDVNWFAQLVQAHRRVCGPQTEEQPVRQVGGNHYVSQGIMPWDLIKSMKSSGVAFVDYARGDIIAYVWRMKGGRDQQIEDLRKAAHFCEEAAKFLESTKP